MAYTVWSCFGKMHNTGRQVRRWKGAQRDRGSDLPLLGLAVSYSFTFAPLCCLTSTRCMNCLCNNETELICIYTALHDQDGTANGHVSSGSRENEDPGLSLIPPILGPHILGGSALSTAQDPRPLPEAHRRPSTGLGTKSGLT